MSARFWSKVDSSGSCWVWTGATNTPNGYGRFRLDGRLMVAHRVAYELLVGPIPEGLQLDHLCWNRRCVNPAHLEPVTARVNNLRSTSVSARNAAKTHCKRGHELVGRNLSAHADGKRRCLACRRVQSR